MRVGKIERNTKETRISLSWNLDGEGSYQGTCGVGFFDHMMHALCVHGGFDCCMVKEFFRALAFQAGITLHLKVLYGENDHHKIEAIFKAFAHALREAVTETDKGVLSSKGVL